MVTRDELIAAVRSSSVLDVGTQVEIGTDSLFQISSHLIRCASYDKMPTVFVPSGDRDLIRNAVVDGVHWVMNQCPGEDGLQVFIPADTDPETQDALPRLSDSTDMNRVVVCAYEFECDRGKFIRVDPLQATPSGGYANHLRVPGWASAMGPKAPMPLIGAELESRLRTDVPSFRWYRNVTSRQWSGRVGGWEVCTLGISADSIRYGQTGEERSVNPTVPLAELDKLVDWIKLFAKDRADAETYRGSRKREHLLESAILRGRVKVPVASPANGAVTVSEPLIPLSEPPLQVPALYSVSDGAPARFIDAVMKDGDTPWVLELKVDSGGQGQYYRHAITQAVLYREFVKQASPMQPWFVDHGVDPAKCRAAVVLPKLVGPRADGLVGQLKKTAACFGVEVVELDSDWKALQQRCMR